ncbi:MAG: MGMT family protein [Chloroflexota bacterium]|nr:MGMT family protein [Chloroflexota bacterium]
MTNQITFLRRVYAIVARIPSGRVTTYGRIARALGEPRSARMVGWALLNVDDDLDLPCHRVVNRIGFLSGGWHFGHPDIMRGLLLDEGVPFKGEYEVDLDRCVWDPWLDEPETEWSPAEVPIPPRS